MSISAMKKRKSKKGGLSTIIASVFMVLLTIYVFTSAIHPTAVAIKDQGQDAGQAIVEEKANIIADFLPTTFVDPTNAGE
ncbi:hypothetical protein ACFHWD_20165 [Clostridium sp. MT-14]|uniref:Uncharacterized protein n=1 Tax=Clostridium aromativorans TaxID=2836848 RepID=A0ABS8NAH9_9CLOT|nr:hypothetical protein [Clostridium aromativorans]MCC9296785.1 hypothetical protein [Clostridium aromativorans]CAB1249281.1 conserved hypothetical protein [Clostridiaceae bacterium BL-3]